MEIPAGILEKGEDPAACAARELAEEVGLKPRKLERLATYYAAPGFTTHRLHVYYTDDVEQTEPNNAPGEILEIERYSVGKIRELIDSGDVKDAKTLVGLTLLALRS